MFLIAPGILASFKFRLVIITGPQKQLHVASDTRTVLSLLVRVQDQSGNSPQPVWGCPWCFCCLLFLSLFEGRGAGPGKCSTTTPCLHFKTRSSTSRELPWVLGKPGPISADASALGCYIIISNRNSCSLNTSPKKQLIWLF